MLLMVANSPDDGYAHSGNSLSAFATVVPIIDGILSPGEWEDAATTAFTMVIPLNRCTSCPPQRSHETTLYVKNDASNLYLAWVVKDQDVDPVDIARFHFDNNHDGQREVGDDAINFIIGEFYNGKPGRDDFLKSLTTFVEGPDVGGGAGTNDIISAASHTNLSGIGDYTFELSHPLDTADDAHDFSLSEGDTVGLALEFFEDGEGAGWWPLPLGLQPNITIADIIIASPPSIGVSIDIAPGDDLNTINCESEKEVVPVAILTTDDFDATSVDHATVVFEGGNETHVAKTTGEPRRHEGDVDEDGDTDLVLHFRLRETSLNCESTDGVLTGQTFRGQSIVGTDAVRMVGDGD